MFVALFWPLILFSIETHAAPLTLDNAARLDEVIASHDRTASFRERDRYRHPKETLMFFGITPDLVVVEVWPGTGWYTEILAPFLRVRGTYYAAHFHVDKRSAEYVVRTRRAFLDKLAQKPALYDKAVVTALEAPEHVEIAPKGSVDLVLTFRNVHNWVTAGTAEATFRAFFVALKPGGVLGVVEHRANGGTSLPEMKRTGYITEAYVIALAQKAGFRLLDRSEINANPRDTKDHPAGVWTLPPNLRLGSVDREKYLNIGESDRMTLKFERPKP
jgi:predicted methyltransferase